jgi:hypothetical protein
LTETLGAAIFDDAGAGVKDGSPSAAPDGNLAGRLAASRKDSLDERDRAL